MGTWSASINGNDTAEDLRPEYQAAFYYYDVDTALKKIDDYVREIGICEEDEEEWCNYIYSLADYMFRKGILTDSIRDTAVNMIDSGFGLEIWEESGEGILNKRRKMLAQFREKLLSEQGPKKKIRIDLNLQSVFQVGDIVAFQIITKGKTYLERKSLFDRIYFENADGKYVVIRKTEDHISYRSAIVPEVADHWIYFQLYKKLFDIVPAVEELDNTPLAEPKHGDVFCCESSLFHFKKRNYQILGNDTAGIEWLKKGNDYLDNQVTDCIYLTINRSWINPDTALLNAILK